MSKMVTWSMLFFLAGLFSASACIKGINFD